MSATVYKYANATMPPAVQGAAVSLLANCDPTLQGILAACAWIVEKQLTTAWTNAAQGFGGNDVVTETYAVDPVSEVARTTWRWPALIAWRGESRFGERTLMFDDHECDIHMTYVLPPLTLEFLQRLSHIRVAVMRCIRLFIQERRHPDYLSGANWLDALNIDQLALVDAEEGDAFEQMNAQQRHVGLRMRLVVKEREMLYDTDMDERTTSETTIVHDDGVSEQLEAIVYYSGGPLPEVAITTPAASFAKVEGDTLTISGTCLYATTVQLWERVDRGVWTSLGILSVVGATTFTMSRLLTSDDVGEVDLKAVATGPGGETTSDKVSGTVTAAP